MAINTLENSTSDALRTSKAAARGERLFPPKYSRLHYHLTALREKVEKVAECHLAHSKGKVLVDYGCGNMPYRPLLEPLVDKYIGCDLPGNELADRLIDEGGVLPFDTNTVDIVFSSQVLEHVSAPAAYLDESYRVLRRGGRLIISTHGMWRYHPDPCDFWRWTCDGLKRQIQESGFTIESFEGVMGPEATALQLWQDAVLPRIGRMFRPFFIRYMQWRIARADRRCPSDVRDKDACVFFVSARKA